MNYKDKKRHANPFWASFFNDAVGDQYKREIHQYLIAGHMPRAFHYSCFSNELFEAANHTHSVNSWADVVPMMHWVAKFAPKQSWGSNEKVDAWLALADKERCKILVDHNLYLTDDEVIVAILSDENET